MNHGIKVLVIDPNDMSRQRTCDDLIAQDYGVTDVSSAEEALKEEWSFFDVIVLEVNLPRKPKAFVQCGLGLQIGTKARERNSLIGILFFSSDEGYVRQAEDLYHNGDGGVGYISKESDFKVISAIPLVIAGNWICVLTKPITSNPDMEKFYLRGLPNTTREKVLDIANRISTLKEDELSVLRRIGDSNQNIARDLHMAVSTVENKFTSIYYKLGLESIDRRLRPILVDRALSIFDSRKNND